MKNKINLANIPLGKTANKWITANFEGKAQKYEIRALNDGEKINLQSLFSTSKDVFRTRNIYVCLLSCGLDIEQEVAGLLFDSVPDEAIRVGDLIFDLSKLETDAKLEESKNAEKNLPDETEVASK